MPKQSFISMLAEPRPTSPGLEYVRRRRLHTLYILLLASVLFWSVTIATLSAFGYYDPGRLVPGRRAGERLKEERVLRADSALRARQRVKRYEIQGRWRELHASLDLNPLPDAPFHPHPLVFEHSETGEQTLNTPDAKAGRGSRRKRDAVDQPDESSTSQPTLFLADDSRSSSTETLEHLRATFQMLARRDQIVKVRQRRLGRIHPSQIET